VPFDLQRVMFITTANVIDTIPPPLRDRMEVIELAGYTEEDKLEIARTGHLIPKQLEENGLTPENLRFNRRRARRDHRSYTARGRPPKSRARDRPRVPEGRPGDHPKAAPNPVTCTVESVHE
jgi:hypothetical protein